MKTAIINKIIKFSNVDGPGNRMAIFFQECSFKCLYCHNPETINRCNHCGLCVDVCEKGALTKSHHTVKWNKINCVDCDNCIKLCPHLSSPKTSVMTVEELMKIIIKQKMFIQGITVSGGECMIQADFLLDLFIACKKVGLSCLIDTNGFVDFTNHHKLMKYTDGVMLDVKAIDNKYHQFLTGQSNRLVLENLKYLLSINKLEEVRTVILPNQEKINHETVSNISSIITNNAKYKLIQYRYFGVRQEGLEYFKNLMASTDELAKLQIIARNKGAINCVIV